MLHLPLTHIDPNALPRDRTHLDPTQLHHLQSDIALHGLRMPIEVWQLSTPRPPFTHALISGFRRLTALHNLARLHNTPNPTAPCLLRTPTDFPQALALMIAENEARAPISPWEKGRVLHQCLAENLFPTLDAAIEALHPLTNPPARTRLRSLATVAEQLDGLLLDPHTLSLRQLLRLSHALRPDFLPLIQTALTHHPDKTPEAQWSRLLPVLDEAEAALRDPTPFQPREGRPRRLLTCRPKLTVRREKTTTGWCLHFTGDDAKSMLMDAVMDEIERLVGV